MRWLLISCAVAALVACQKPAAPANQSTGNQGTAAEPEVPVKGVDRSHKGHSFPHVTFLDEEDQPMDYKPLLGVPTLVNLWATWCAPCVKELPTLERLSKRKDVDLYVATISQDSAPRASVEAFMAEHKLDLPLYRDPKMAISGAIGAEVLPTSILYDANGKEVWRYVGDMDWTSPEAAKLLAEGGVASPH
jgi:thiol-disulfide isomerase/thioredoxin